MTQTQTNGGKKLTVGSVFSGLGGFDLGLERAGMEVLWQVEIDSFRRRILKRHWSDVEQYEDVRKVGGYGTEPSSPREQQLGAVNLLCGGFPCQDLSVAGRRAGLSAERSGLFFEFARLAGELRPDWLLIENVPGLLSSNKGEDFETVLETLSKLGYAVAWRILDSRYFGVPQRRRRVYIIGHSRADCATAVLFEPEGGAGNTQAGGEKGKGVAYALTGSPRGTGDGHGNAWNTTYVPELANARRSGHRGTDDPDRTTIVSTPADPNGVREVTGVPRRLDPQPRVVAPLRGRSSSKGVNPPGRGGEDDENLIASTIVNPGRQWNSQQNEPNLITGAAEGAQRPPRLPKPCCPDGPRYAALGDAVTTNVVEWIGRRMMVVDKRWRLGRKEGGT